MGSLTAIAVKGLAAGRHHDGDGLWCYVRPSGARSWVLRVVKDGRRSDMGVGSYPAVTLADARTKATKLRSAVKGGDDPLAAKREAKAKREDAGGRTFARVAERLHADLAPGYRNPKHSAQWLATMKAHAFPAFGDKPIAAITGPMVIDALDPIWTATPETAHRVRQRIAAVLDYAHALGWRDRAPDLKVITKRALRPQRDSGGHHAAVEHPNAPVVLDTIREAPETMGRLALLFTIYTAARSGETRGATWGEVDVDAATWTIPGERMKAGKPNRIPLSAPALAVLDARRAARRTDSPGELIFPSARLDTPLSDMTMAKAQRLAAPGTTVHGWRSTFRDWAGETTGFASDVCEAALAHAIGGKVRVAHQRGDLFEKRRELMNAWAGYLAALPATLARLTPRYTSSVA